MKFSVLMSVYFKDNPGSFDQCLKSIWDFQTVKPSEIVLVKDGPLPPSLELVIENWLQRLGGVINIVELIVNNGLGSALNIGLSHCSNEWVFRMDADDFSLPNRFETQIEYINNNSDIVVLGGQILEFCENLERVSSRKEVPLMLEDIKRYSQYRCPFNHMTVAFKREAVSSLGGYHHHLFMEDYNLWLRVLARGYNVANLPDILVHVRAGSAMFQRRKGIEYLKSEKQLLKLQLSLHPESMLSAYCVYFLRSFLRLIPLVFFKLIYLKLLRKNIDGI